MSLLLISYPDIAAPDLHGVIQTRQKYAGLRYSPLPLHFTLIFPTTAVGPGELATHVENRIVGYQEIPFTIRCSIVFNDLSSDDTYVLLVPDEGFSSLVRLHDKLYDGILTAELRLDLPFVPHITVGYSPDRLLCKQLVDELNQPEFAISGIMRKLDLVSKEGGEIRTIRQFHLATTPAA